MSEALPGRIRVTVADVDGASHAWAADELPPAAETLPEVRSLPPASADRAAGRRRFEVSIDGWIFQVTIESEARAQLRERAGQGRGSQGAHGAQVVSAQVPGRVVRVWVAEGDTVEVGQRLLAIEAMKMENEVRATRPGTVDAVRVAVGGSVELGDELLTVR